MKKYTLLWLSMALLVFNGCELIDKAEEEIERIKHQYEEYVDGGEDRGERPFTIIYQEDENAKTVLISSQCTHNAPVKYTYYTTPSDANNRFLLDTQSLISSPGYTLQPFWDIRYVNPVSQYINNGDYPHLADHSVRTGLDTRSGLSNIGIGTYASQTDAGAGIVQAKCVDGSLAAGTTINLYDAPEQYLNYGGPQSTFAYLINKDSHIGPWKSNETGNLVLQGYFDAPLYNNYEENIGGGVYFNFFIRNKKNGKNLNFVVGIYASGVAWIEEKAGMKFDPTTNIVHVATVASENSWWSTISPKSKSIEEVYNTPNKQTSDDGKWNDFFRINVSYHNLLAVLQELATTPPVGAEGQDFGLNPEDWELTAVMLQYELEETGGKGTFSGSFKGFEAYLSEYPL